MPPDHKLLSMDSPSTQASEAELNQLATLLQQFGCPGDRADIMASQLDKRARQLSEEKEKPYQEALMHLLKLMRQGWAAKEKGL